MNAIDAANMALDHLGSQSSISSLDENSREARVVARHFENTLLAMLRKFDWNFARGYAAATPLVTDSDMALTGWSIRYTYPADALRIWGLVQDPAEVPRQPFYVASNMGTEGTVVFTNQEASWLRYTRRLTDPTFFPEDFMEAFTFRLAARMALPLTRDTKHLGNFIKVAEGLIAAAQVVDANEGGPEYMGMNERTPETVSVRGAVG